MRQVRLPMKNIKLTDKRVRAKKKTDEEYTKLKKAIKQLGLSNPIIVNTDLELIDGFWRLKAFIELHNDDPSNEGFLDIPTIIVNAKEEVEDLKLDVVDGRATDYMRDTAIDRMNMIYDPREFRDKALHEYLELPEVELQHRLELGEAIRKDKIAEEMLEKYKSGILSHAFLYNRWKEDTVKEEESDEEFFYNNVEPETMEVIKDDEDGIVDYPRGQKWPLPKQKKEETKKFDVNEWI